MDDKQTNKRRPAVSNAMDVREQSNTGNSKKQKGRQDKQQQQLVIATLAETASTATRENAPLLTPSLEDCVRYLVRNPAMRQIIGELIRQEQSEKEQQQANHLHPQESSPGPVMPDSNTVIQQWMHQFETSRYLLLAGNDGDDAFLCNANDYNTALSDDNTLDDDDEQNDKQIPDQPQDAPSPTAALQGIIAHFDTGSSKLVGFTMKYSDGIEIQESGAGCDLRGTKQIPLQLHPNEHFVAMTRICFAPQQTNSYGAGFYTTENRYLEAMGKGPRRSPPVPSDEINQIISSNLQHGEVIRGCEMDATGNVQICLAYVAEIDKTNDKPVKTIPPLEKLAWEAATLHFKNKAMEVERKQAALRQATVEQITDQTSRINQQCQQQLQNSPQAVLYRLLASLMDKAKAKLDADANELLGLAKNESLEILRQVQVEKGKARLECAKEHLSILREHQRFLDTCAGLSGNAASHQEQREWLCFAPTCRKLFTFQKVAKHKRCTVPGCTIKFPNCGCSIIECDACHEIICKLHLHCHDCPAGQHNANLERLVFRL